MAQVYSAFFTLTDASKERSSMTVQLPPVDDATLPVLIGQLQTLETAINGMTSGPVHDWGINLRFREPVVEAGRREQKILVTYTDTSEYLDAPANTVPNLGHLKRFSVEVPCWDTAKVDKLVGTDFIDMTDPQAAAFIAAFEAVARSPFGGAVEVVSMIDVGRNS